MDYEIPEPRENPIASLVMNYKLAKEIEFDDRGWDKKHWGRCARHAKELLEICGIYESARRCLEELSGQYKESDFNWNFGTIVSNAHDWKTKQEKSNDKQKRQRFLDALARQRTEREDTSKGKVVTGGKILGPLGNLEVFQDHNGAKEGRTDNDDGKPGKRMEPLDVEAKEARRFERG